MVIFGLTASPTSSFKLIPVAPVENGPSLAPFTVQAVLPDTNSKLHTNSILHFVHAFAPAWRRPRPDDSAADVSPARIPRCHRPRLPRLKSAPRCFLFAPAVLRLVRPVKPLDLPDTSPKDLLDLDFTIG